DAVDVAGRAAAGVGTTRGEGSPRGDREVPRGDPGGRRADGRGGARDAAPRVVASRRPRAGIDAARRQGSDLAALTVTRRAAGGGRGRQAEGTPRVAGVFVNGGGRGVAAGGAVGPRLGAVAIDRRRIGVERNKGIVPRAAHATTPLAEGDRVEIVTMVGGG